LTRIKGSAIICVFHKIRIEVIQFYRHSIIIVVILPLLPITILYSVHYYAVLS